MSRRSAGGSGSSTGGSGGVTPMMFVSSISEFEAHVHYLARLGYWRSIVQVADAAIRTLPGEEPCIEFWKGVASIREGFFFSLSLFFFFVGMSFFRCELVVV